MSLRQNVRNLLCGATLAECKRELEISIERCEAPGEQERAQYIREWIAEVEAEQ